MSDHRVVDRHELLARVEAGGTITPGEMRAVLDALAAAEDAAGVKTIRREIKRLEVIVEQRDQLYANNRELGAMLTHQADEKTRWYQRAQKAEADVAALRSFIDDQGPRDGIDWVREAMDVIEASSAERNRLTARVTATLTLHPADSPRIGNAFCVGCGDPYPCLTRQALEGAP